MRLTDRYRIPVIALSLLFILLLNGCAALRTTPEDPLIRDIEKHQRQLARLKRWTLEGKLGYQNQQEGGSALLRWQQDRQDFDLRLSGPFGFKTTRIVGDNRHAELQQSGMTHYTATSASELTSYLFGWAWPVDELLYWIKGIPAPDETVTSKLFDDKGRLTELQQSGWRLRFSDYQETRNLILPGRISGNSGELRFTLVIKNWQPQK